MIVKNINHNFENEVQVVTQLFPYLNGGTAPKPPHYTGNESLLRSAAESGAAHSPVRCSEGYEITTEITDGFASASVAYRGKTQATHRLPITNLPFYLTPRRVLMLVLYHALQEAVGAYTPWGALTGIRPSKMVRDWLAHGFTNQQVIDTMQNPFCCAEEKAKLALDIAHAENRLTKEISTHGEDAIGIYIGIPFCPTRCAYCSFNVDHNWGIKDMHEKYVDVLIAEIKQKKITAPISSIYIGGGTPTVLNNYLLEKLLSTVAEQFDAAVEYTVEAGRPDTLTTENLALLRRYGANRIAVNPQTLNNTTLKTIGRRHTAEDFYKAFSLAKEAGFNSINSDIIVGLPGETVADVARTMENLMKLSPDNVTVHTLAVKRASNINSNKEEFALPSAKTTEAMLNIAASACTSAGLSPYYLYRQKNMTGLFENVGYSKPGHECLYNIGMMSEVQTVIGFGAGAVSKFVIGDKITREFNVKNPEVYVERRNQP